MKKFVFLLLLVGFYSLNNVAGQTLLERQQKIRAAVENSSFGEAVKELQAFRKFDAKAFELNNYDYLLGRLAAKNNDSATAATAFQTIVKRDSGLRSYALWQLALMMRGSGNLMLERLYLEQLIAVDGDSLPGSAAIVRLARSYFESRDFPAVIQTLSNGALAKPLRINSALAPQFAAALLRDNRVLLAQAYLRNGAAAQAREVFTAILNDTPKPEQPDDAALAAVRGLDELDSVKSEDYGRIAPQTTAEAHFRRAKIYQFNRAFIEARLHYHAIDDRFPMSSDRAEAVFQLGRIAVADERYDRAFIHFERLQAEFAATTQARDALAQEAAAYARSGNADEAISHYKIYIAKYIDNAAAPPENSERSYLNIIDALRDKGRDADALNWIALTRQKFKGQLAATQALFSKVRIHLAQTDWTSALSGLDELAAAPDLGGVKVSGGTSAAEVAFLKAYCLAQLKRFDEAVNAYLALPAGRGEYYGWRADEQLRTLAGSENTKALIAGKLNAYRNAAKTAIENKEAERARQIAQTGLRLTFDSEARRELLDIVRRAYALLPNYSSVPNGSFVPLGRQQILTKPIAANSNPHRALADELFFLNLYDEAAPEYELSLRKTSSRSQANSATESLLSIQQTRLATQNVLTKSPAAKNTTSTAFALAAAFNRGDLAQRAVSYAEPLWRNVPADYLLELAPREAVELLYPAPYKKDLLETSEPLKVDSRFLLAIMRQESRFQADAKSNAAARGLMQFIPSTAERVRQQLNRDDFELNDLYNPPTAILFGATYLSSIFKQFQNQPAAVAASYNGGESNVLRWILRSRTTDVDRYVPEIQFTQSKDYVYKVMINYQTYQTLYDERLQPR